MPSVLIDISIAGVAAIAEGAYGTASTKKFVQIAGQEAL